MSRSPRALSRPVRLRRPRALAVAAGLVIAVGVAAGCGGKVVLDDGSTAAAGGTGGGTPGSSCDFTASDSHVCATVIGASAALLSEFQDACTEDGGTMLGSCTSTNSLGICSITAAGITESVSFYAGGSNTAATAEQMCAAEGGTWTAG